MNEMLLIVLAAAAATASPAIDRNWAGLYRKPNGVNIGIGELHEFGRSEIVVDYTTGEAGALFDLPDGTAGVSDKIGGESPKPVHVLKGQGGAVLLDGEALKKSRLAAALFRQPTGPSPSRENRPIRKDPKKASLSWSTDRGTARAALTIFGQTFFCPAAGRWWFMTNAVRVCPRAIGINANFIDLAGDARKVVGRARAQPE